MIDTGLEVSKNFTLEYIFSKQITGLILGLRPACERRRYK